MKHHISGERVQRKHYRYTKYKKYYSFHYIKKLQRQLKISHKNIDQHIYKLNRIRKFLIILLVCVIFLSVGGAIVLSKIITNYSTHQFKDISLEETMNKNPDNGLQKYAIQFKNTYCQLFKDLKLTDISTNENSDSNGSKISMMITGKKDKFDYAVFGHFNFNKQNQESYSLLITGKSEKSLIESFEGDKEIITKITKVMSIDNAYDKIEEGRTQIKPYLTSDKTLTYKQGDMHIREDLLNTWTKYQYTIKFESKTSQLLDSAIIETEMNMPAFQFINRMDELFKNLGFEDRKSIKSGNRDSLYNKAHFSGIIDNITYWVGADFYEDGRIYYMLRISGESSESIRDSFPKNKEIIVKVSEALGIKDAYQKINKNRLLVKPEVEDGETKWRYIKSNPLVQIFQSLDKEEHMYYYIITLGIDWELEL